MFRMWGKIFRSNRMLRDAVIEAGQPDFNRTRKVFYCLEELCRSFDLSVPIWLDKNIKDFQRVSKARFTQDSFIDSIDFDYLEIQVIEED